MIESILVYPEIFSGYSTGSRPIRAFFTVKMPGVNREAVCLELGTGPENLFMPVQKHTNDVIVYEDCREDEIKNPPEADAVITAKRGVALGIMVADCVPALLYDKKTGAIGAVHAGWRGTAKGILIGTIEKMRHSFGSRPGDMRIAIGPAIRKCCYEVDMDVLRQIETSAGVPAGHHAGNIRYYGIKGPKAYIDLPEANRRQAIAHGVKEENIWLSGICTSCQPEKFHSYRREFRLGAKAPGRQGGFIIRL